jgi:hypothetical protein
VRALTPGQIGSYVTPPSNASTILVDRRSKVDITTQIEQAIANVSFTGGVFKLDLSIRNKSASTYFPIVDLNVVSIKTNSGLDTVSVKNAENGGNGKSAATAALFGYSNLLGSDQLFSGGETTSGRTLEFNDSAAEMFTFNVVVTAFQGGAGASPAGGSGAGASPTGGSSPSAPSLQSVTKVLSITVNPLTKTVTAKLL